MKLSQHKKFIYFLEHYKEAPNYNEIKTKYFKLLSEDIEEIIRKEELKNG